MANYSEKKNWNKITLQSCLSLVRKINENDILTGEYKENAIIAKQIWNYRILPSNLVNSLNNNL